MAPHQAERGSACHQPANRFQKLRFTSIFDGPVRDWNLPSVHRFLAAQGFGDRRSILCAEFENAVFSPHLPKSGAVMA
jgi:hypothetical protein